MYICDGCIELCNQVIAEASTLGCDCLGDFGDVVGPHPAATADDACTRRDPTRREFG
jgi:hypothetical protein